MRRLTPQRAERAKTNNVSQPRALAVDSRRFSNLKGGALVWTAAFLLSLAAPALAQTYAIRGATIVPVTSPAIPNGTIVIRDGTIEAVGANVSIPKDAKIIDGRGLTAYPGLIDPYTAVGLTEISSVGATVDTSEMGDLNPHLKASSAFNPHSEHIPVARTNGITTVIAAPRGGLFGGQAAFVNLDGWVVRDMLVKDAVATVINFPREVTVAANTPDRTKEERERERRTRIDLLKKTFRDAQAFARVLEARPDAEPNTMLRSLAPVVRGQMPAMFVVQTEQEIKDAIAVIEEFSLKAILVGCQEAWKVAALLRSKNVPVLLGAISHLPISDGDPYDSAFATAAALSKAGVKFAFTTADSAHVRDLPFIAGMASAFGLPKEEALKGVTIYAAEILGVADRVGSLTEGKIANILLTNGDPLELRTEVKHLFIAGKPVDLTNKHTELFEKFSRRP